MAIPPAYIQELVSRNDIYSVVSGYVSLQRAGRLYKGLCPFHSERSPSFFVYPESQSFYCFGCGAGGDVINFVMRMNSLTYIEAVRFLAQSCGMPMPNEDDGAAKLKSRILQMNKTAARFFYDNLNTPAGQQARGYLRQRQLSDRTIVNFGLGYAPAGWDALRNHLHSKGYTDREMKAAYLVNTNSKGHSYDVFRDRIMFPIIDLRGNVIAFGGRRMGEDGGPKYLNSGDTPVFKKSNGLFALNLAKKSGKDTFILAEGYMDVISMHQAGFDNAVATLGTALTQNQARLIADYAKRVIVSYDSDEAGQKATRRAMDIFSKEDIPVQVLQIRDAKDPDEFIKKFGRAGFAALLEGADSATDFTLAKLKEQYDISQPSQRVEYITKACGLLAQLTNVVEQDVYCARLATQTGTDKSAIKQQLENISKRKSYTQNRKKEQEILKEGVGRKIKVNYRDKGNNLSKAFAAQQIVCAMVKNNDLYPYIREKISPDSISDSAMRQAFEAFESLRGPGDGVDFPTLSSAVPGEVSAQLAWIFARNADIIISHRDVDMYIEKILSGKLSPGEAREKSLDELSERIRQKRKQLKEKEK